MARGKHDRSQICHRIWLYVTHDKHTGEHQQGYQVKKASRSSINFKNLASTQNLGLVGSMVNGRTR